MEHGTLSAYCVSRSIFSLSGGAQHANYKVHSGCQLRIRHPDIQCVQVYLCDTKNASEAISAVYFHSFFHALQYTCQALTCLVL